MVSRATRNGTAAQVAQDTTGAKEKDYGGSAGGCLPTTTLRIRETDDETRGDDEQFRGDEFDVIRNETSTTKRVDAEVLEKWSDRYT